MKAKGAAMPMKHSEKTQPMTPVCGVKYNGGQSTVEVSDKRSAGLANYVKKNKMK